jgi:hypothetical protein
MVIFLFASVFIGRRCTIHSVAMSFVVGMERNVTFFSPLIRAERFVLSGALKKTMQRDFYTDKEWGKTYLIHWIL